MLNLMGHRESLPDVIRRAAGGDDFALGELFSRYGAMVFKAAFRVTGSPDEADDVTQDVFVGLPEALRRYSEQAQFDAWLKRMTIRVALVRMRRERRRSTAAIGDDISDVDRSSTDVDDIGARVTIERALAQIAEPGRVVFTLKAVEGYSHAEIAKLLGISRSASEVRYWRAIRQLRHIMETAR